MSKNGVFKISMSKNREKLNFLLTKQKIHISSLFNNMGKHPKAQRPQTANGIHGPNVIFSKYSPVDLEVARILWQLALKANKAGKGVDVTHKSLKKFIRKLQIERLLRRIKKEQNF